MIQLEDMREIPLSFVGKLEVDGEGRQRRFSTAPPPCPFVGKRLMLPNDIAGAVTVVEIYVNGEPTFGKDNENTPGRLFSEFCVHPILLNLPVTTRPIDVVVRNEQQGGSLRVSGVIVGSVIERHPGKGKGR